MKHLGRSRLLQLTTLAYNLSLASQEVSTDGLPVTLQEYDVARFFAGLVGNRNESAANRPHYTGEQWLVIGGKAEVKEPCPLWIRMN